MKVRWVDPEARIGAERGDVVVCIPLYGAHEYFIDCLRSVLRHTPARVRILVCDDASPDGRSREFVRELEAERAIEHELFYARRERNVGFPANVNAGLASSAPADVVILNSDCVVGAGWIEGLRNAAYADSTIATATALTNHGSIVSVPEAGSALSDASGRQFEIAVEAIRSRSLRLRPRLITAVGHCVYVRRGALDLVGAFDLGFSPGYGEEVDFSQRCLHSGLCHVAADDVLVLHHGGASLAVNAGPNPVQSNHELKLAARYPYYHEAVRAHEADSTTPLARCLGAARRALTGLSVVIDARVVSGPATGTQRHVLELVAAIAATGQASVKIMMPPNPGPWARRQLAALGEVEVITVGTNVPSGQPQVRADIVHRPYQVESPADLASLARFGDRLIITHQDLISYRNPSYFGSFGKWEGYRSLTRRALATADRVLFFSAHARDDALAEHLVDSARASVVHIGVDHRLSRDDEPASPPSEALALPPQAQVMLCIGTDYRHKNRIFALRVLDELQRRYAWNGRLVLAGPRVRLGSSHADEQTLLGERTGLREAVIDVGAVTEAEKEWLLGRADLVLYPTVYEGFGLVPFEAADHGVPCLWAPGTSLSELLPDASAGIVPWDACVSADRARDLMCDPDARSEAINVVRHAAAGLRWETTARSLIELYNRTCDMPPTPAGARERGAGLMRESLSEDAVRLVGPDGALGRDLERPLLALATHPRIGEPVFRAIKAGYRASHRLRRLARTTESRNGSR